MSDFEILYRSIVCVADVRRRDGLRLRNGDRITDSDRPTFCTQSAAASLAAARCGNFQLQLTTSLASCWKSEVSPVEVSNK
ncbi:MAG: hypothetical protein V7K90_15865 [Nostoc sp.]|uniref:hypothetical protein n=1 Tax=Nostoc sp. TaxID=1180 RepID=UPI002FF90A82